MNIVNYLANIIAIVIGFSTISTFIKVKILDKKLRTAITNRLNTDIEELLPIYTNMVIRSLVLCFLMVVVVIYFFIQLYFLSIHMDKDKKSIDNLRREIETIHDAVNLCDQRVDLEKRICKLKLLKFQNDAKLEK